MVGQSISLPVAAELTARVAFNYLGGAVGLKFAQLNRFSRDAGFLGARVEMSPKPCCRIDRLRSSGGVAEHKIYVDLPVKRICGVGASSRNTGGAGHRFTREAVCRHYARLVEPQRGKIWAAGQDSLHLMGRGMSMGDIEFGQKTAQLGPLGHTGEGQRTAQLWPHRCHAETAARATAFPG